MEKSDFDHLLERYLKNEVSEEERIKLEAWLDVMKTDDNTDLQLSKAEEDKLFQKLTDRLVKVEDVVAFRPNKPRKIPVDKWLMRMAASLLIICAASFSVWYWANSNDNAWMMSGNGVEKVILNDGSLVWLRGESNLAYYEKQDEGIRFGELEGEALFEVTKDPTRPFIVQCGDVKVKVLGTSFSLRKNGDQVELKVLTGKVNISSAINDKGIDVEPNEQAIYRNGEIEKLAMNGDEVAAVIANTEYNMQFRGASMADVADRIEDKFNVKINYTNKKIKNCRITADFTDHALKSTLQMIVEVLDVTYVQKGNVITLSGSDCSN
jgi:ferric-dicitrate binding protein FerR (iron transport regulator)